MSELKRFKRLITSMIPKFASRKAEDFYVAEDARSMINEMAMSIPPKVLKGLLDSDRALDEFINGVFLLEDDIGKKVVLPESVIDPQFNPKAHLEDGLLVFTITYRKEEIAFAEFKINYKNKG